jgi:acyl carrier protein
VNSIQARLTRCFAAVFPNIPEQQITTASLETVEGWDSIAAATLITLIEEEFGMEFDGDALSGLTSFEYIFGYLTGLKADQ